MRNGQCLSRNFTKRSHSWEDIIWNNLEFVSIAFLENKSLINTKWNTICMKMQLFVVIWEENKTSSSSQLSSLRFAIFLTQIFSRIQCSHDNVNCLTNNKQILIRHHSALFYSAWFLPQIQSRIKISGLWK